MREETGRRQSLVARLGKIRRLEGVNTPGRQIPNQVIADALIKGGYLSLYKQAKAELGMLNNKTIRCILANPDTPVSVRVVIQAALEREKRLSEENTSRSQKV